MDFISPRPFSSADLLLFQSNVTAIFHPLELHYWRGWIRFDLCVVVLYNFLTPFIFMLSSAVRPFDTSRPKSGPAGRPPGTAWANWAEGWKGCLLLANAVCGCWWQRCVKHCVWYYSVCVIWYDCMSGCFFGRGWREHPEHKCLGFLTKKDFVSGLNFIF